MEGEIHGRPCISLDIGISRARIMITTLAIHSSDSRPLQSLFHKILIRPVKDEQSSGSVRR